MGRTSCLSPFLGRLAAAPCASSPYGAAKATVLVWQSYSCQGSLPLCVETGGLAWFSGWVPLGRSDPVQSLSRPVPNFATCVDAPFGAREISGAVWSVVGG